VVGQAKGCLELLVRWQSSRGQQTRQRLDDGRGTVPRSRRTAMVLHVHARGVREVQEVCRKE
jgi:hypothetical protein